MNNFFKQNDEFKKCAPNIKYTDGSCFTYTSLQKIANSYNKIYTDKIDISLSKQMLVKEITKRISQCKEDDQLCWLEVDFIKNTRDNEILKNTFRPLGPQGRFKWLSTTNINQIIKQYENVYKDFKFLGAVPYDFEDLDFLGIHNLNFNELIDSGIIKIGMVINLDESWKSGSHWVALFANLSEHNIYYYDSYGIAPRKRIRHFAKKIARWCYNNKINKEIYFDKSISDDFDIMNDKNTKYERLLNIKYNKTQHQEGNSECGVYSVNFILRLLKGETFEQINKDRLPDETVNECRKIYFRFK